MPKEDWIANPVHKILAKEGLWPFVKGDIKSVLDVACGLSLKSKFLNVPLTVGVDIHEPYLKAIENKNPYAVLKYDIKNITDLFMHDSFDIVYALDVIEHLEKQESLDLIADCIAICRKAVVVETPKGYIPQNIDIQGFEADEYQEHRCGWEVEELDSLGFSCVVRPYRMQDIRRHTIIEVGPDIELINAIYIKKV